MVDATQLPTWANPEIFPEKPSSHPYGIVTEKGHEVGFESLVELEEYIGTARNPVGSIWTPEQDRTMPMEAEPRLVEALRKRYRRISDVEFFNGRTGLIIYGVIFGWVLIYAWSARGQVPLFKNQMLGLAGMLLIILGLSPVYEAWKLRRETERMSADNLSQGEREARFDYWLAGQKMPVTMVILGLIAIVAAGQVVIGWDVSAKLAGLVKKGSEGYFSGAYWRLWTAPLLHGQWFHLLLNGFALWVLGRRTEALACWPHLAMVFVSSALVGGIASAFLLPDLNMVGASGGILGLLGFLIVFETLHPNLVPRSARRRLLTAVVLTFIVGFVAQSFIDNAAHGGGLLAGMAYALLVFPKSSSFERPRATKLDRVLGVLSLLALTVSALWALMVMLAS